MSTLLEYTGELVVLRCWCGVQHAIPYNLRETQLKAQDMENQHWVYCPLGHKHAPSGKSSLKVEQEAHQRTQRCLEETQRREERAENRRRAEKAAKTRIKNRIANGVCPCCTRSFKNLHRHMQSQHPDFTSTKE